MLLQPRHAGCVGEYQGIAVVTVVGEHKIGHGPVGRRCYHRGVTAKFYREAHRRLVGVIQQHLRFERPRPKPRERRLRRPLYQRQPLHTAVAHGELLLHQRHARA